MLLFVGLCLWLMLLVTTLVSSGGWVLVCFASVSKLGDCIVLVWFGFRRCSFLWVVLVCVLCWFAGSFVARGLPGLLCWV